MSLNVLVVCIAAAAPDAVLPQSMTNKYLVWLNWEDWPAQSSLWSPDPAEHGCNTPILRYLLGFGGFVDPADLVIEVLVQVLRQWIQRGSWEQNNPLGLSCLNILL